MQARFFYIRNSACFFACPLRVYVPTSFIVEFIAIILVVLNYQTKVSNGINANLKNLL